ncbi:Uncharacterized protein YrzB, UPF0473 family [Melghirimyces thermohalophilus]|uniref:UPF0473 protein SAMN04488112_11165 n=1 Tax=Melghirimyces thermohalophilus TaxID=1236220 RepID=A0A1G6MZB0_9BACL|nr:DUF1292 domain-containing protein [Melghirimyces thermohalophilus]SDC60938.1 Uncharacterized protein YrzB, UPF0473 family [Melghirimyces thermohalophilus]
MSENGNHEHEHQHETVLISNEDGQQETFEVLYRFERDNGQKYILLIPAEQVEEAAEQEEGEPVEQEVYAFRYEGEGEDIQLIPIENDKEWDMVEEVLNTLADELDDEEDHR